MSKTSEELEEEDLYEVCSSCRSMKILEYGDEVYCADCGAANYTELITETEYLKDGKIEH